jgi:hypothetical protein
MSHKETIMKKAIIALGLVCTVTTAVAQHYHGHGFRHHGHHRGPGIGWWVAPVVVGAIGYELGRQQVIVQPQPTVIVQPQPVFSETQTCTPWKELQMPDGKIYRERTCQ